MTSQEYRALRASIGSQAKVAAALGLNITTIQRREAGKRKMPRSRDRHALPGKLRLA